MSDPKSAQTSAPLAVIRAQATLAVIPAHATLGVITAHATLGVIPAKAGIQFPASTTGSMSFKVDSRLRGNDNSTAEALQ